VDKYQTSGLRVLFDQHHTGRPVEIDAEQRAKITALAANPPPEGHSRWSLRLLAQKAVELGYCAHVSHSEIRRTLKKTYKKSS
jgi:transposase